MHLPISAMLALAILLLVERLCDPGRIRRHRDQPGAGRQRNGGGGGY